MKRFLAALMLLGVLCGCAFAEESGSIDVFTDEYMQQNGLCDETGNRLYIQSVDWDGDVCCVYLTDMSVYLYSLDGTLEKKCTLPEAPANFLLGVELSDAEINQLYAIATDVTIYNGVIYGYNTYSGAWGTIDADGVHWNGQTLDFSCLYRDDVSRHIVRSVMTDEALIAVVYEIDEYGGDGYVLFSFDLASGASRRFDVEGLRAACRGDDGALVCLTYNDGYSLATLDVASGATTPMDATVNIDAPEGELGGLAYDAASQSCFLAANGYVYRSVQDAGFDIFSNVSTRLLTEDTKGWALPGGRYAMLLDGMHVRSEGAAQTTKLVVGDPGLTMAAQKGFEKENPGIELDIREQASGDDIIRQLITRDDAIDVYVLEANYLFTSMKNKGLTAPLDSSETLTANVAAMYGEIQALLTNGDGELVAYPEDMMLWYNGINEGYWSKLWGDRALPSTYGETLDAWIEWERDYAQDYVGVGFTDSNFDYAAEVERLVQRFALASADGGQPDLSDPALKSALEKLAEVYELRKAKGRPVDGEEDPQFGVGSETGPGAVWSRTLTDPMNEPGASGATLADDYLYGVAKNSYTSVNLSMGESARRSTGARMYVYVVNPYSKHLDEAVRFIEYIAGVEINPQLYYALYPQCNELYAWPDYEEVSARYMQRKQEYEAAIGAAQEEGRDTAGLETEMQYYADWLADESNRWLVSQSAIEAYRATIASYPLDFHAESLYTATEATEAGEFLSAACARYAQGRLTLDALLTELSEKMTMISMENG